jgi:hypothetical protein
LMQGVSHRLNSMKLGVVSNSYSNSIPPDIA